MLGQNGLSTTGLRTTSVSQTLANASSPSKILTSPDTFPGQAVTQYDDEWLPGEEGVGDVI